MWVDVLFKLMISNHSDISVILKIDYQDMVYMPDGFKR